MPSPFRSLTTTAGCLMVVVTVMSAALGFVAFSHETKVLAYLFFATCSLAAVGILVVAVRGAAIEYRRLSRIEAGRCPRCNYDLRATPDRCPECGHTPGDADVSR